MLSQGDRIKITCEGRTVDGRVVMINRDETAAMVEFEAILEGYAGSMPLLRDGTGAWRDAFGTTEITIVPIGEK